MEEADNKFGHINAHDLIALIADIEAFDNVEELVEFLGNEATALDNDSLLIKFGSEHSLKFVAAGTKFDKDLDRVVWQSVQRLKLLQISELK